MKPTAIWKVALLGIIATALIGLGAGMVLAPPVTESDTFQQATPCSSAGASSDNCYAIVPVTVMSTRTDHLDKAGPREYVSIQTPNGPTELGLPEIDSTNNVLVPGASGTVEVYHGQPVLLVVWRIPVLHEVEPRVSGEGNPPGRLDPPLPWAVIW